MGGRPFHSFDVTIPNYSTSFPTKKPTFSYWTLDFGSTFPPVRRVETPPPRPGDSGRESSGARPRNPGRVARVGNVGIVDL